MAELGYFTTTEQKFFVTGHSYNHCDRAFGLVEKRMRKLTLQLPNEIEQMIRDSCDSSPFVPIRMAQADILNFKECTTRLKFPTTFRVTKHLKYRYETDEKLVLICEKDFLATTIPTNVNFLMDQNFLLPAALTQVQNQQWQICPAKLRDLEKLTEFLQGEALAWYLTIIHEQRLGGTFAHFSF